MKEGSMIARRHHSCVDFSFLSDAPTGNARKLSLLNSFFERAADRHTGSLREEKLKGLLRKVPSGAYSIERYSVLFQANDTKQKTKEREPAKSCLDESNMISRGPFLAVFEKENSAFILALLNAEKSERDKRQVAKKGKSNKRKHHRQRKTAIPHISIPATNSEFSSVVVSRDFPLKNSQDENAPDKNSRLEPPNQKKSSSSPFDNALATRNRSHSYRSGLNSCTMQDPAGLDFNSSKYLHDDDASLSSDSDLSTLTPPGVVRKKLNFDNEPNNKLNKNLLQNKPNKIQKNVKTPSGKLSRSGSAPPNIDTNTKTNTNTNTHIRIHHNHNQTHTYAQPHPQPQPYEEAAIVGSQPVMPARLARVQSEAKARNLSSVVKPNKIQQRSASYPIHRAQPMYPTASTPPRMAMHAHGHMQLHGPHHYNFPPHGNNADAHPHHKYIHPLYYGHYNFPTHPTATSPTATANPYFSPQNFVKHNAPIGYAHHYYHHPYLYTQHHFQPHQHPMDTDPQVSSPTRHTKKKDPQDTCNFLSPLFSLFRHLFRLPSHTGNAFLPSPSFSSLSPAKTTSLDTVSTTTIATTMSDDDDHSFYGFTPAVTPNGFAIANNNITSAMHSKTPTTNIPKRHVRGNEIYGNVDWLSDIYVYAPTTTTPHHPPLVHHSMVWSH